MYGQIKLENHLQQAVYDHLDDDWKLPGIGEFSSPLNMMTQKMLYRYQIDALKAITGALHLYFHPDHQGDSYLSKKALLRACAEEWEYHNFNIYSRKPAKAAKRFDFLKRYYPTNYFSERKGEDKKGECVASIHFFNRLCLWMATGSGKSLVLIKTIELLDYLQSNGVIPQRDILVLLPRADLIQQFKKTVEEFNFLRHRPIDLVSLKNYESDKFHRLGLGGRIKVYYYRSDLLRDARKDSILDFKSYENGGHWYVFLDEAHRGKKQDSKMQDYIATMSREGFLFNFSATFTDELDFATTAFNFNLKKYIEAGYGKNIYLSDAIFRFNSGQDELDERNKQKQVLKSLITFALIKKSRTQNKEYPYHAPLMLTLVNSVNTESSDLRMFFKQLEKIAGAAKLDAGLFAETLAELQAEWLGAKEFIFGEGAPKMPAKPDLSVAELRMLIFHSSGSGKIEIITGERGKELALKLETADKPFALIKIGDADKFKREHLGENYLQNHSYDQRSYFAGLNDDEAISILLGSRSFYEGWDSNRPNVVNFINIGRSQAKKFILQALGRGLRIEPKPGQRTRAAAAPLLETLFVYATDKEAVKGIVESVNTEKKIGRSGEIELSPGKKPFDLLIPFYKEKEQAIKDKQPFALSAQSRKRFEQYLGRFDKSTFILKEGCGGKFYDALTGGENLFEHDDGRNYPNMPKLLGKILAHLGQKRQYVKEVVELQDEIIHFKHIRTFMTDAEHIVLKEKVEKVALFEEVDDEEILIKKMEAKEITPQEFAAGIKQASVQKHSDTFERDGVTLDIRRIAQHYYLPVITSDTEQVDYIRHIIKAESERDFIDALEKHLHGGAPSHPWMFSKIDESLDSLFIPYFDGGKNRHFYPDFIFWLNKGDEYKIIFVDPKGIQHTGAYKKAAGFVDLFLADDGTPKRFPFGKFKVTFDLKFVVKSGETVLPDYRKFCIYPGNFEFLNG